MGGSAETSVTSGCCRVWKGDRQMEQRTEYRAKVMFRGHKDVSSPFSLVLTLADESYFVGRDCQLSQSFRSQISW